MSPATELIVCTTCRPVGADRSSRAAGQALLDAVLHAAQGLAAQAGGGRVAVRGVACLSACSRACTVALQAAGKASYLFGELPPDAETAALVLACAQLHAISTDGQLGRAARPERLRNGILARLPALARPD